MGIGFDKTGLTRSRQKAETLFKQLQENRERLQLVQQAANIGIFEWNIRTGIISWTKEAEALYGLAPGSFGGDLASWEQAVHPADLPEAQKKLMTSVARKTDLDIQFRVIWPDDQSVHWIYAKARTFYDEQEQPLRMLGINIDITDRKHSEEQLIQNEEKLRLFIEASIIGVIFCDIHGTISYANDAFLSIIGYSRNDFEKGHVRWTDITPPEWLLIDQQHIGEVQKNEESVLYEKQYIHKEGRVIDVLIGFFLFGERRDQAVAFVLDVTERKHLERQKDEFLAVISHELRTPVTSLKVFAQLLQKRFKKAGDSQNEALLTKMNRQIDKLTMLIEDLIDVTKLEAGQLQLHKADFDLAVLIDEIIEEMQRTTTQHSIIKEGTISKTVWGDQDRLGQVLTNLLSNAIKYSPQANRIIVKVTSDDEQVTVSVQDFGLGIASEKQEKIFQRFYRVEEKSLETIPGMGLGLYISAEMIRRHGGVIWFESTPWHGSNFSFSIPLIEKGTQSLSNHEVPV